MTFEWPSDSWSETLVPNFSGQLYLKDSGLFRFAFSLDARPLHELLLPIIWATEAEEFFAGLDAG